VNCSRGNWTYYFKGNPLRIFTCRKYNSGSELWTLAGWDNSSDGGQYHRRWSCVHIFPWWPTTKAYMREIMVLDGPFTWAVTVIYWWDAGEGNGIRGHAKVFI